jgi:hypothetical protein
VLAGLARLQPQDAAILPVRIELLMALGNSDEAWAQVQALKAQDWRLALPET